MNFDKSFGRWRGFVVGFSVAAAVSLLLPGHLWRALFATVLLTSAILIAGG